MNINIVMLGLLAIALSLHFTHAYFSLGKPPPSQLPWVPIDVNKQRSFVNQTRDAGMFIENSRRLAIIGGHCASSPFSYKGSTNGSLESYFLTALCPVVAPKPICPVESNAIWSDGTATDEICDVIDAGGAGGMYDVVDLGGAAGNVCDV
jgi:hypothetical protein